MPYFSESQTQLPGEEATMNAPRIRVGEWFKTIDGESLEIVALDHDEGVIEVQFYDGTVEEYEMEDWDELEAKPIAPPEDWSGSYDLSRDDYGVDLDRPAGDTHINPLDQIDEED
jgi:hypothetical protein